MNNNASSNNSGFGNGFVLGALIGAAAVFLAGTKKGKKLFKTLTEEGIEGLSDLEDMFIEDDKAKPSQIVRSKIKEVAPQVGSTIEKITTTSISKVSELAETASNAAKAASEAAENAARVTENFEKKAKRFFRGTSKRRLN